MTFYYLTVANEKLSAPRYAEGAREGILRGMYRIREGRRCSCSVPVRSCAK